jgi:hypothetical protein
MVFLHSAKKNPIYSVAEPGRQGIGSSRLIRLGKFRSEILSLSPDQSVEGHHLAERKHWSWSCAICGTANNSNISRYNVFTAFSSERNCPVTSLNLKLLRSYSQDGVSSSCLFFLFPTATNSPSTVIQSYILLNGKPPFCFNQPCTCQQRLYWPGNQLEDIQRFFQKLQSLSKYL